MIVAVIIAINKLYNSTFIPIAFVKLSSKVIAKFYYKQNK